MRTRYRWLGVLVLMNTTACEVEPAEPTESIQSPWQFSIEFALENYGDDGEYIARARLYNALDALDPVGNAGKSLRLSDGDEVYADDVHLDVETRTAWTNRESFDYSAAVGSDKMDYRFEFRRPDEMIAATIPSPPAFEAADIGEVGYMPGSTALDWTPLDDERWVSDLHPNHGARKTVVNISMEVLDDDCVTLLDGNPVFPLSGAQNLLDSGTFRASLDVYHSPDHDCSYDIIFERTSVKGVSGTWTTEDGLEVPTNGATAYARHTVRKRFVALQRQ